jgi:hypothetical protein
MKARAQLRIVSAALATSLASAPAFASEIHFGASDIPTVFYISKSDDHNRVDYGMRLNDKCAVANNDAVFPYWREFEHAPPVRTHSLGIFEYFGYGISEQRLVHAGKPDAAYQVRLKQFKKRPVWITTKRDTDGHCHALARCEIAGIQFAELLSIYVKLAGPLSVEYIIVKGRNRETGKLVEERIDN